MNVGLVLTHDCNLACRYCYAGRKTDRQMPESVAVEALGLAERDRTDRTIISFFGGEPFLAFDRLSRYTRMAVDRLGRSGGTLLFTVSTNATLLDHDKVAFLREHGFYVGVSIDGDRAAHDACRRFSDGRSSFEAAREGMKRLKDHQVPFKTISVVDPANVRFLAESVHFLVGEGVVRLALNPNYDAAWSDEDLLSWQKGYQELGEIWTDGFRSGRPIYINVLDEKVLTHLKHGYSERDHCDFGRSSVAVAPSGNLYPCERLVGEDAPGAFCIGNTAVGFSSLRNELLSCKGNHNPDCAGCTLLDRCASFCPCANLADTGRIDRPGGLICWHEKEAVAAADRAAEVLYREHNPAFLKHFYNRRGIDPDGGDTT